MPRKLIRERTKGSKNNRKEDSDATQKHSSENKSSVDEEVLLTKVLSNIAKEEVRSSGNAATIIPLFIEHLHATSPQDQINQDTVNTITTAGEASVAKAILRTTTEEQRFASAIVFYQISSAAVLKACMLEVGFHSSNTVECDPLYIKFAKCAFSTELCRLNQLIKFTPHLSLLQDEVIRRNEQKMVTCQHDLIHKAVTLFQIKNCSILKKAMLQAHFHSSVTHECHPLYIQFFHRAIEAELVRIAKLEKPLIKYNEKNAAISQHLPEIDAFDQDLHVLQNFLSDGNATTHASSSASHSDSTKPTGNSSQDKSYSEQKKQKKIDKKAKQDNEQHIQNNHNELQDKQKQQQAQEEQQLEYQLHQQEQKLHQQLKGHEQETQQQVIHIDETKTINVTFSNNTSQQDDKKSQKLKKKSKRKKKKDKKRKRDDTG